MTQEATSPTSSYSIISYPGASLPDTYHNMVLSKWLRSLRYGNTYFKLIDSSCYFAAYNSYIESVLHRPNTTVRLAVLSDDHDVVLGFSVLEANKIHFCHCHKDVRNQGIGTSLIPKEMFINDGAGYEITHVTTVGLSIWSSKLSKAIFNPF